MSFTDYKFDGEDISRIIDRANCVFGRNGWSSSVVSLNTDFVDCNEKTGKYNVAVTAITRIVLRDGGYHDNVGCGFVENCSSKGAALEKCKKEAVADGMGRTLCIALGNRVNDRVASERPVLNNEEHLTHPVADSVSATKPIEEDDSPNRYFNSDDDALYAMVNTETYDQDKPDKIQQKFIENTAVCAGPSTTVRKSMHEAGSFKFRPGMSLESFRSTNVYPSAATGSKSTETIQRKPRSGRE